MADQPNSKLYWNKSSLTILLGRGRVRFFNPWSRRNVVAEHSVLDLVDTLIEGLDRLDFDRLYEQTGRPACEDVTDFTLWDNAYCNSDFFPQDGAEAELERLSAEDFLEVFADAGLIADSPDTEFSYDKRHMADRFRGNFYEQIGTEGLFNRTVPAQWWTAQKFEPDMKTLRDTPYKFIEQRFLEDYFKNLEGQNVLDIGSGTGFFTSRMARHAETVLGLDYDADYVAAARRDYPKSEYPNLDFVNANIIDLSSDREGFSEMRFDRIVMIDMFLFLFNEAFQSELWKSRERIMENVARLLRPGGQLLIMDPHPLWLTPWVGSDNLPFGIVTEYRRKYFKVSPSLEELTCLLHGAGISIRRILEPTVDDAFEAIAPKAYRFMSQVPQWWFVEAEKK